MPIASTLLFLIASEHREPTRALLDTSGFLYKLPKKITQLFMASGAIFILGAMGFEMPGIAVLVI